MLQSKKSINLVVRNLIKIGKSDFKSVDIALIQFLIKILGKNFNFDEKVFIELTRENLSVEDLAFIVFKSQDLTPFSSELLVKEFLHNFLEETNSANLLESQTMMNWGEFLLSIITNKFIPRTSPIKGRALMLVSFMLKPVVDIYLTVLIQEMPKKESEQVQIFKNFIFRMIETLVQAIQYEKFGFLCAKEYTNILLRQPEFIVKETKPVVFFCEFLKFDNRQLIVLALKTLDDLCQIQSLNEETKKIVFEPIASPDNENETLIQKALKLLASKRNNLEVISLLKSLAKITDESEILLADYRYEIFFNIFSKNKKIISETFELMTTLNVDFWQEVIKMLNYFTDEDVDIMSLISNMESITNVKPESLLEVLRNSTNEIIAMRRAAEIFSIIFRKSCKKEESIDTIVNTLELCKCDESTFVIVLNSLLEVDDEVLINYFLKDQRTALPKLNRCISNAFKEFNKPLSLNILVSSLRKLYTLHPIATCLVSVEVREMASDYYKKLRALRPIEFAEREKLVPKISALFEVKTWALLQDSELVNMYDFCQKYCINIHYTHFAQFSRFFVNILKHIWMLISAKGEMIIESDKLAKDIRVLHNLLKTYCRNQKLDTVDSSLLLSSILDLHVHFQPKMREKYKREFFSRFCIPMPKDDFITLVELIESTLFSVDDTEETIFSQKSLFKNFIAFYKNFVDLPSLTAWEALLRHYNAKSLHKADIETLMVIVMSKKKTIFEKSVAFAILNLASGYSLEQFRAFYGAFDEFMRKKIPDFKQRGIVFGVICSIILDRFSKKLSIANDIETEEDENRLNVLDFIEIMIKKSDYGLAANLIAYLKISENFLSNSENQKLDSFKNFLLEH